MSAQWHMALLSFLHKQTPPAESSIPRSCCSPYPILHPFVQARCLHNGTWLCLCTQKMPLT